jgi:RNA-directed DNA polymerase
MQEFLILLVLWVAVWLVYRLINHLLARRQRRTVERWMARPSPSQPPAQGATPPWPPAQGSTAANPAPAARVRPSPPPPPPPQSLNLDAGAFKPVSHAEARQLAGGVSTWSWAFGRRDIIPPASDARTILIDRAMVGQGIITPEELARIHTIGEQMDQVRPTLVSVHAQADRAVAEDREARQRIKQQKKAEAAERKRLRAEAVKQRKASDIVYLGRGVSKGLADRKSNEEKLAAAGLPLLSTPADVAAALKLSIPRLRWLAFHADASPVSHYARFTVPKRSGGERLLSAPMPELAAAQEWVLVNLLEKLPTHPAAHGFVPGRSTVSNAEPHVSRDVVVNTDLKDFFPSITFHRVAGLFRMVGYSPAVATIFALLCTDAPRKKVTYAGKDFYVAAGPRALPQGACTSPAISNLVSKRLDSRLAGIATKMGWTYTRYADDISLSADGEAAQKVGYMLARVRHIAEDEGFSVNHAKTRVLRQSTRQLVTGVVVNDRPGIDRATVRRLRAILHHAKTEGLAAQNREKIPHFEASLAGMIAYVHMVNPQQAAPLREAHEKLTA